MAVNNRDFLGEAYGIRTPGGVLLIDSGPPVTGPALINEVLEYFRVSEPVTHLIITHGHWDHAGGAKELQESGVKVIVSAEDVKYCVNGGREGMRSPFVSGHDFPAFTPDIVIKDDQIMEINGLALEFIGIPGHTPGSMAVRVNIDHKIALFTGDALQIGGKYMDTVEFGWRGDPNFSRESIVSSMYKLSRYEADIILPGHGKVCLRNGKRMLEEAAQQAFLTLR
jgi:glyoxylase-like metal-dependent hydrolase (beta-lactamase superfamily II)